MKFRVSPAMMVAVVALVFAVTGAAVAGTVTSANKKKHRDRRQDLTLIRGYLKGHKVPLATHADSAGSAKSAKTAAQATSATKADTAKTATTATNANAVGGKHVSSIFYESQNSGPSTTIFDRDGLTLKASCNAASGATMTARTTKNNSSLIISRENPAQDDQLADLDTGSDVTIMNPAGTGNGNPVGDATGNVTINYASPLTGANALTHSGAAVVSASLQVWRLTGFAGAQACVITGTAVSSPPVTPALIP